MTPSAVGDERDGGIQLCCPPLLLLSQFGGLRIGGHQVGVGPPQVIQEPFSLFDVLEDGDDVPLSGLNART